MHTSSKLGAAVAALLLTGAGCSMPGLPGMGGAEVKIEPVVINKTSTATNGGTCAVNLNVPKIDSGHSANDDLINSLMNVNTLVMLDGSVEQTLEEAADAWLADCISKITLPYENNSLSMQHTVGIQEADLFSVSFTSSRQFEDRGLIAAFADLYNTKTGDEYELVDLVKSGAMSDVYKLVFTGLLAQHKASLDESALSSLEAVAQSGDVTQAEELLSTSSIDFFVKPEGIIFPFASEEFVPLEAGRLDVMIPWSSLDGLLEPGTALADWRK